MLLEKSYADRLTRLQTPRWKRFLNVQAPYGWNLRRLEPGRMLDIGCGIGRNLAHVPVAVGVDPNEACVDKAKALGFEAFTPQKLNQQPASFDSLLIAHVLEHLTPEQSEELFNQYLPYLKPGGRVIIFTPQECGFKSDPTHVRFVDFALLREIVQRHRLVPEQSYSFPFPRWAGGLFKYNEFVVVAQNPSHQPVE